MQAYVRFDPRSLVLLPRVSDTFRLLRHHFSETALGTADSISSATDVIARFHDRA
jgi:hypothetical protein